jgi:peptidoglycan/xylan/chitin deacetylase (PgdA/CDA1 family)
LVVALLTIADAVFAECTRAQATAPVDALHVPILVYHNIAPHHPGQTTEQRQLDVDTPAFREQMQYLAAQKYDVISMDSLVNALGGQGTLPDHPVVITFDDGWQTQYERAYPILRQLGFTATFFIYTDGIGAGPAFMTWDEIRELQRAGMTIGAHSRTHPNLTGADVNLRDEIQGSRDDIEHNLGTAPDLFAYPYGDWNSHVADVVRDAGFRAARAFGGNDVTNVPAERYSLRAVMVTDDMATFDRILKSAAASP